MIRNKLESVFTRLMETRSLLLRRMLEPSNAKNVDLECGHPPAVSIYDYKEAYQRGDIASRVVCMYPDECWVGNPEIYETDEEELTPFEKAWISVAEKHALHGVMHRIDCMSGIGRFGILLLGFDDGKDLDQPIDLLPDEDLTSESDKPVAQAHKLLYTRTLDESLVNIGDLEEDTRNPRYGLPKYYQIRFTNETITSTKTVDAKVHWSRVVHVADNRTNSEVLGDPRMMKVWNRLLDLKKIAGSSAEMFWKGGFPGLSIEAMPDADEQIEFDKESAKKQVEDYMNGLQRYMALIGMQAKSLAVQIADPRPQMEVQIRLIATAMSVPWRLLLGVEVGALASEQDVRSWNKRMQRRRDEYLTPYLIKPMVNRLIGAGVLPKPKQIRVAWQDLNTPAEKDVAIIAERRTNALLKYVQGAVDRLVPPYHYLTEVIGLSDEQAKAIIKKAGDTIKKLGPVMDPNKTVQGFSNNRPPAAGKGTAARRNGSGGAVAASPAGAGRNRSMSASTNNEEIDYESDAE